MEVNRFILFLCLYETVLTSNNGNDGEAMTGRGGKLKSHEYKEEKRDDQDTDVIDPLEYLDSLMQDTINSFSTVTDVTHEQQYIVNLRDKYVQFRNALEKAQAMKDGDSLVMSFYGHQDHSTNIPCAGNNCFKNDSGNNSRPQKKLFDPTITWLRHTVLRHMFLNTVSKCTERIFNNTEITVNVERRTNDFYVWAVIPQKVLNERKASIKTDNDTKHGIVTDGVTDAIRDYKTGGEKLEDSTESVIAIQGAFFGNDLSHLKNPNC
ncbi:hypothetical protein LOAG_17260 [Loa loa]|uniref:Astacin domain-containing protein n=1 Tax=Loa loa TaxID=7209 RepID=A0A1I7VJL9_LOALO|nr:hypothetical protein LOAG_17260 [Loa loa]EJD75639.1 hypothetical protein LOAG_17260 [Loa loa]